MKDGLYQVTYKGICAGFIVRDGKVKRSACASILINRLSFWVTIAVRIAD